MCSLPLVAFPPPLLFNCLKCFSSERVVERKIKLVPGHIVLLTDSKEIKKRLSYHDFFFLATLSTSKFGRKNHICVKVVSLFSIIALSTKLSKAKTQKAMDGFWILPKINPFLLTLHFIETTGLMKNTWLRLCAKRYEEGCTVVARGCVPQT